MTKLTSKSPYLPPEAIAAKGEELYEKERAELEKKHKGKYIAIDIKTGKRVLDNSLDGVMRKAKRKMPNGIFFFKRIGFSGVFSLKHFTRSYAYSR